MNAAGLLLDRGDRILRRGVDRDLGAEFPREGELVLRDVDRSDPQAHRDRVLHGDVPEPPDAGDRHPLPGAGAGALEALVDGDAGAQDRCDLERVAALGQAGGVRRIDEHVLAERPVDRVAAVALLLAEGLPAGAAVLAHTAGRPQPGVADQVAHGKALDAVTELLDASHPLVAGDERRGGFDRPVAGDGVEVGVAHPGGECADQCLAGPGSGTGTEVTSSGAPKAVATAACMSAMTCSSLTGAGSHLSGRGARPDPGRRYEDEIGPKRAVVPG